MTAVDRISRFRIKVPTTTKYPNAYSVDLKEKLNSWSFFKWPLGAKMPLIVTLNLKRNFSSSEHYSIIQNTVHENA